MAGSIEIDDMSDLALALDKSSGAQVNVCVSSHILRRASPVWKRTLAPDRWSEASQSVLPMPEDDFEAMMILLKIFHMKYQGFSTPMSKNTLLQIAILCDKYDLSAPLSIWLDRWAGDGDLDLDVADSLFCFYAFHMQARFVSLAVSLVKNITLVPNGSDDLDMNAVGAEGRKLVSQVKEYRNMIIPKLMIIRDVYTQKLLDIVRDQLSKAKKGACRRPKTKFGWECKTLLRESLKDSLKQNKLDKYAKAKGKDRIPIHESINEIWNRTWSIKATANCFYDSNVLEKELSDTSREAPIEPPYQDTVQYHNKCQHQFQGPMQGTIADEMRGLEGSLVDAFKAHWRSNISDTQRPLSLVS